MLFLLTKELGHRWIICIFTVLTITFIATVPVIRNPLDASAEEKIDDLSHKLGKGMLVVPVDADLDKFYSMQYGSTTMPDNYGERIKSSPPGKHVSLVDPRLYGNITITDLDMIMVGITSECPESGNPGESFTAIGSSAVKNLPSKTAVLSRVAGIIILLRSSGIPLKKVMSQTRLFCESPTEGKLFRSLSVRFLPVCDSYFVFNTRMIFWNTVILAITL